MKSNDIGVRYYCILCNITFGDVGGRDIGSHGICIKCLANYINKKKISKGFTPCFGILNQGVVCGSCRYRKFCEEYYRKE